MQKINLKFLYVLLFSILLIGCSQTSKKAEDQYLNDAKAKLDEKKFDEAITEYREFLKNYPQSDKAVFAYNQIAGIQIDNMKNPQEGIKTYKEMADKFPGTKDGKQAMFMVAFMYDETLKDKDNAIASYKAFLEKYPTDSDPNDKMSESAKTMLEVLQSGKSIEEIIQQNINKMGDTGKINIIDQENPTPVTTDTARVKKPGGSPTLHELPKITNDTEKEDPAK